MGRSHSSGSKSGQFRKGGDSCERLGVYSVLSSWDKYPLEETIRMVLNATAARGYFAINPHNGLIEGIYPEGYPDFALQSTEEMVGVLSQNGGLVNLWKDSSTLLSRLEGLVLLHSLALECRVLVPTYFLALRSILKIPHFGAERLSVKRWLTMQNTYSRSCVWLFRPPTVLVWTRTRVTN